MIDESKRVLQGREMDRNLSLAAVRNFSFTKMKTVSFCKSFLLSNLPSSVTCTASALGKVQIFLCVLCLFWVLYFEIKLFLLVEVRL